jgi:hypothetical protein
MAQTQSATTEGYTELGKFASGEAASKFKSVCCLKTSCTADGTQTSAGVTKSTDTGLDLQDADTVKSSKTTVDNDTVQVDNKFTAATGDTLKGFGVWNDDDDVLYAICCFAADVTLAASDTLTVQMKYQFKAD